MVARRTLSLSSSATSSASSTSRTTSSIRSNKARTNKMTSHYSYSYHGFVVVLSLLLAISRTTSVVVAALAGVAAGVEELSEFVATDRQHPSSSQPHLQQFITTIRLQQQAETDNLAAGGDGSSTNGAIAPSTRISRARETSTRKERYKRANDDGMRRYQMNQKSTARAAHERGDHNKHQKEDSHEAASSSIVLGPSAVVRADRQERRRVLKKKGKRRSTGEKKGGGSKRGKRHSNHHDEADEETDENKNDEDSDELEQQEEEEDTDASPEEEQDIVESETIKKEREEDEEAREPIETASPEADDNNNNDSNGDEDQEDEEPPMVSVSEGDSATTTTSDSDSDSTSTSDSTSDSDSTNDSDSSANDSDEESPPPPPELEPTDANTSTDSCIDSEEALSEAIRNAPNVTDAGSNAGAGESVIVLCPGETIAFTSEMDVTGKAFTLECPLLVEDDEDVGDDSSSRCVLSGNNSTRLFRGSSPMDAVFHNVTLQDGTSEFGGLFYISGGSLTFHHCSLQNSSADAGGALYIGGADTTVILDQCAVKDNSATNGGAIYTIFGNVELRNSTLSRNVAATDGGALLVDTNATIDIFDTVFSENSAERFGGAIAVLGENGLVDMFGAWTTRFINNRAEFYGSDIYIGNSLNESFVTCGTTTGQATVFCNGIETIVEGSMDTTNCITFGLDGSSDEALCPMA